MNITNIDYIELKKTLEAKGLLKHTPAYYFLNFFINILLLVISFAIIFYFRNWYATILMSIAIAFIGMQLGYLGHDAGHRSISKSRTVNELIGHFSHSFFLAVASPIGNSSITCIMPIQIMKILILI